MCRLVLCGQAALMDYCTCGCMLIVSSIIFMANWSMIDCGVVWLFTLLLVHALHRCTCISQFVGCPSCGVDKRLHTARRHAWLALHLGADTAGRTADIAFERTCCCLVLSSAVLVGPPCKQHLSLSFAHSCCRYHSCCSEVMKQSL